MKIIIAICRVISSEFVVGLSVGSVDNVTITIQDFLRGLMLTLFHPRQVTTQKTFFSERISPSNVKLFPIKLSIYVVSFSTVKNYPSSRKITIFFYPTLCCFFSGENLCYHITFSVFLKAFVFRSL